MHVLITGSNGFIGRNLTFHLNELGLKTEFYTRKNSIDDLPDLIEKSNFIVHLAGENRPLDIKDFDTVNVGLTKSICELIRSSGRQIPILLASSIQAELDNVYGKSKLEAENILRNLENEIGNRVYIYRLPGVFGKWCKPNYNSVVATFCHNISHNLNIKVSDPSFDLNLVYIDDVIKEFVRVIMGNQNNQKELLITPQYKIKLGDLASQIKLFRKSRESLISERVGDGLVRKLYSTYVSYLPPEKFSYEIPSYTDERGIFAEIVKSKDSGQFSFFTAKVGATRGGHYHHTKTEKFLVVQGKAKFGFRQIFTDETYEISVTGEELRVIESIPGWSHNVTNVGNDLMIVMLWANEIFDSDNPDTITHKVIK